MELELITSKAADTRSGKADLLFVHGAFSSAPVWQKHFIPYFNAHGYDCHALSLRAHGQSSHRRPLHMCGLVDYAEDIETVLERLPHSCVVIAHSLSALVLLKLLKVRSLYGAVLMNPMPPSGTISVINHLLMNRPDLYFALCSVVMTGPILTSRNALRDLMLSDETQVSAFEGAGDVFQHESLRALTEASFLDFPYQPFETPTPSLVIGGDRDHLISVSALEETASYIGGDLVVVEGAPHAVMLDERWETVARPTLEWIEAL